MTAKTATRITTARAAATGRDVLEELPGLTPLRGLAALAVLLYHSSIYAFKFAGGAPPWAWRRGSLAVDLFFFLSGFVLTHVYERRFAEDRSWRVAGRFLWTRFSRIYPASLFTTLVFVLAFTLGNLPFPADTSFTKELVASLLLVQVPWLGEPVINSPSWSISAEWYAYLMFPFVAVLILKLRNRLAAVVFMALLVEIVLYHTIFTYRQHAWGWGALVRALPEFTAGIFAYRYYRDRLFQKFWEKDAVLIAVAATIAAACLVGAPDSVSVILLLALLLASVSNAGRVAGILNARPLRWLGEVSYSVYIFQMLPFLVAVSLAGTLVAHGVIGFRFEVVAALFALGCGVLVHRCVDLPARGALRRLPDRMILFGPYRTNGENPPDVKIVRTRQPRRSMLDHFLGRRLHADYIGAAHVRDDEAARR
jgi:peptidoglycan/LPS O-acetylase OafA/YrhL